MRDWQEVKRLLSEGRDVEAVHVAAKLRGLGEYRDAIQSAAAAIRSPQFYRELGRDPDAMIRDGVRATKELAYGRSENPV